MKVIIIVAYGTNRCIGKDGKLPWKLPTDMHFFKQQTIGSAVLMGRKTYESIPKKSRPLPDRENIVLSRTNSVQEDGVSTFPSLREAIIFAEGNGHEKCFIIGGGEIYKQVMEEKDFPVDDIIATEVKYDFDGDTFFPEIDRTIWKNRKVLIFSSENDGDSHDLEIVHYTK
jgi:dihydrofolate reductase